MKVDGLGSLKVCALLAFAVSITYPKEPPSQFSSNTIGKPFCADLPCQSNSKLSTESRTSRSLELMEDKDGWRHNRYWDRKYPYCAANGWLRLVISLL